MCGSFNASWLNFCCWSQCQGLAHMQKKWSKRNWYVSQWTRCAEWQMPGPASTVDFQRGWQTHSSLGDKTASDRGLLKTSMDRRENELDAKIDCQLTFGTGFVETSWKGKNRTVERYAFKGDSETHQTCSQKHIQSLRCCSMKSCSMISNMTVNTNFFWIGASIMSLRGSITTTCPKKYFFDILIVCVKQRSTERNYLYKGVPPDNSNKTMLEIIS